MHEILKDLSHEILKSTQQGNSSQFQTKGGISDGALRVTYYDSWGLVSCYFFFHVADLLEIHSYIGTHDEET